jgi:TonB family protein
MTGRDCCALLGAAVLVCSFSLAQSTPKPIDKDTLLESVKAKIPTPRIIGFVQDRGVDFLLTPQNRKLFLDVKADPVLLEAVAGAYRAPECPKCAEPVKCPEKPPETPFEKGPPLSKAEVLILLDAKVPLDRIEKIVDERDVCFEGDTQTAKEILAHGGSKSLNGTILQNYTDCGPVKPPVPSPTPPTPLPVPTPTPAPPIPLPSNQLEPVNVDWNIQATKLIKKSDPIWPPSAKQQGAAGLVMVRVRVGADGKTKSAQAISGHQLLRVAAEDAVRKWVYSTTTIENQAREVITTIPIDFKAQSK